MEKNKELKNPDTPSSICVRICTNLSIAIETAIYIQTGESIKVRKKFILKLTKLFYRTKTTKTDSKHYSTIYVIIEIVNSVSQY